MLGPTTHPLACGNTTKGTKTVQITTKYHGPKMGASGRTIGARVTATAAGRRVTVAYDHAERDPYVIAARALAAKLGLDVESVQYVGTHNGPGNTYSVWGPGMIHMTSTGPLRRSDRYTGRYAVLCRCGWSDDWPTQAEARTAGDVHLAVANAAGAA